jgi:hypothetical protein
MSRAKTTATTGSPLLGVVGGIHLYFELGGIYYIIHNIVTDFAAAKEGV